MAMAAGAGTGAGTSAGNGAGTGTGTGAGDSGVETGNESDNSCSASCDNINTNNSNNTLTLSISIQAPLPPLPPPPPPWRPLHGGMAMGKVRVRVRGGCSEGERGCPYSSVLQQSKDTRLRMAASTNNIEAVTKVLDAGADPSGADAHGRTPLHLSACRGYKQVVKLLLSRGANPNKKDSRGSTPLHLAACTSHVPVIIELLDGGADVSQADSCGRNPLQLAQSKLRVFARTGSQREEVEKVKQEITLIVDMMSKVLTMKNADVCEIEDVRRRLEKVSTGEQMDDEIQRLLRSLDTLNISP